MGNDLCFKGRKDSFDKFRSTIYVLIRSQPIFTELDRVPNDPELVEHVLILCSILRRSLAAALHQGHDSVFGADILDEDGGSEAGRDSREGEKTVDVLV